MTPERWQQIQTILDRALTLEGRARSALIEHACGDDLDLRQEVESLIESDSAATTPLDRPVLRLPSLEDLSCSSVPERLGPYRILEVLDRGGMGEVFLAERDDASYTQRVAIKILQLGVLGPETIRRFRGERQILAQLDHPNIAKILDGGSTEDGRPYLVLELVEGQPIDVYCAQGNLDLDDRLRLFIKVCQAVQFAHQSLVVHRDLKPTNILVTQEGEPKLLDFGIAKLLDPSDFPQTVLTTAPGFLPMTPAYASPEQVRGDAVTTATDVYALGVLLFELLAGERPYTVDRSRPQEAMRAICELDPARPSTVVARHPADLKRHPDGWRRRLAGDLDSIVLKALRKEPLKRYPSAAEFEADIDRHLRGLPVLARDATWGYRARKFIVRNQLGLGLASTALLGIVLFMTALLIQRAETTAQQMRSERVSTFMVDMFAFPDPSRSLAESITVREMLDRGARQIETDLNDQPDVQADLLATMGRSFKNLGLFEKAEPLLSRALALRDGPSSRTEDIARATILHDLAHLALSQGDYPTAAGLALESLRLRRRRLGESHVDVVRSLLLVGSVHNRSGDHAQAEERLEEALAIARSLGDLEPLATVLDRLAQLRTAQARYGPAEALFEEALRVQRRLFGEGHPTVALTLNNYAALLETVGSPGRAETLLVEAERIQRARYQDPHPYLAATLHNLGRLEESREQWDRARRYYEESLALDRAVQRGAHPSIGETLQRLAKLAHIQNNWDEADRLFQESIAIMEATVGVEHPRVAGTYDLYAQLLVDRGALDRAEDFFRKALSIRRTAFGEDHPSVAVSIAGLARLSRARQDNETAARLYLEALDLGLRTHDDDHVDIARIRYNLALAQRSLGQLAAAAENLTTAERGLRRTVGDNHGEVALCQLIHAMVEIDQGRPEVAEQLARRAQATYERGQGDPDGDANAASVLGRSLFEQQRYAEAEEPLRASYDHYQRTRGPTSRSTQIRLDQLIALYEAWGKPDQAEAYRALRSASDD